MTFNGDSGPVFLYFTGHMTTLKVISIWRAVFRRKIKISPREVLHSKSWPVVVHNLSDWTVEEFMISQLPDTDQTRSATFDYAEPWRSLTHFQPCGTISKWKTWIMQIWCNTCLVAALIYKMILIFQNMKKRCRRIQVTALLRGTNKALQGKNFCCFYSPRDKQ